MSRNPEKNAQVRESRKQQILDAALSVYVRLGYHGTDMDAVAEEAHLAKGLLYYYYKTKQALFMELYTWMFDEAHAFSTGLLEKSEELSPIEQLMHYAYGMFGANKMDPRLMQFSIRMPFDAYAIFGPEGWREGAQKSDIHRKALVDIITSGMVQGQIPPANPVSAASSFWAVFVGNVFDYSKLMMGSPMPHENEADALRNVVRFCFQGLGVGYDVWNGCLEKIVALGQQGGSPNEGIQK